MWLKTTFYSVLHLKPLNSTEFSKREENNSHLEFIFCFLGDFCENIIDFDESHTAIEDAEIETMLFAKITKKTKNKFEMGIIFFPFRELGTVEWFEVENGIKCGF